MKYTYTILYVDDVNATLDFYHQAFGFEKKFVTPEADYGELDTGCVTIGFASIELGKTNFTRGFKKVADYKTPLGIELAFVSEDIETDFKTAIDAGAEEYEPISEKPWGQKVGYVRDINGLLIEICSPMSQ